MESLIQLNKLTKIYKGHAAIRGVTATIQPGAIGLLGPNGAGKSTLIKSLLGLVSISSGTASILGHDVKRKGKKIRELIGYMPEDECFFSGLTGIQSVAFAGELAGMAYSSALRRGHEMLDFVLMDDERYRKVDDFSTGMKQKIKLAQALIHSPKLLFLDEPTNGLDPKSRKQILSLIPTLAKEKGVSVVISTHILHDVESSCDSIVILDQGKLLKYGRIDELKRQSGSAHLLEIGERSEVFEKALLAKFPEAKETEVTKWLIPKLEPSQRSDLFSLALQAGTAVRRLQPAEDSLQDVFLKAVQEANHANL